MPSSISNSEAGVPRADVSVLDAGAGAGRSERPGFVPLTASDRPGVAQPIPERIIPQQPWAWVWLLALVLFGGALTAWELYWRGYGALPSSANSNGAWAEQRRRIDNGEGNSLVLVGSSRVLYDVQLAVWEKTTGERPIQLALEGTSAVTLLEDLAADTHFTGRVLAGVDPDIFFPGYAYRADALADFHKQGPAQRVGQWLSAHFVEPYFAFYDGDFALDTVLRRQPWPLRPGMLKRLSVRKLSVTESDRNTHLWSKVETDLEYRELARNIWAQRFTAAPPAIMGTPEKTRKLFDLQIERAVRAVATLRGRGVQVVFVRMPSVAGYYAWEEKTFPRASTWDLLLKRTQAPGIHFKDYPQLQGYELPEWSHLATADAQRLTSQLAPLVEREFAKPHLALVSTGSGL
jgi:hypothetical protein